MPKDMVGKEADVICQHTKEHKIIPMRVRFENDDGMMETYNILSYKDMNEYASDGLPIMKHIWKFLCKLDAGNGREGMVLLRCFATQQLWTVEIKRG